MFWTKVALELPEKVLCLKKEPKEDERVAQGHFHERVDVSSARYGHFGTDFKQHKNCECRPVSQLIVR